MTPGENSQPTVTLDACTHVPGPFFHGTRVALQVGDELVPGRLSNFNRDRVMNHVYFTSLIATAAWGAQLAAALAGEDQDGLLYEIEPTGPFEDDPNVTDRKFPGNPTRSYRSRHPLRIVAQVRDWQRHDPATLDAMLAGLQLLREQGRDVIED